MKRSNNELQLCTKDVPKFWWEITCAEFWDPKAPGPWRIWQWVNFFPVWEVSIDWFVIWYYLIWQISCYFHKALIFIEASHFRNNLQLFHLHSPSHYVFNNAKAFYNLIWVYHAPFESQKWQKKVKPGWTETGLICLWYSCLYSWINWIPELNCWSWSFFMISETTSVWMPLMYMLFRSSNT